MVSRYKLQSVFKIQYTSKKINSLVVLLIIKRKCNTVIKGFVLSHILALRPLLHAGATMQQLDTPGDKL